jgi:hypothetical protein
MARFFDSWFGTQVLPRMFRSCVLEFFESVRPGEQAYFRKTRERLFGQSLEAVAADAQLNIAEMREALVPMRIALSRMPYLGGKTPNYADHIAWAAFVGFAPIVKKPLLARDDTLHAWLASGVELARMSAMPRHTGGRSQGQSL